LARQLHSLPGFVSQYSSAMLSSFLHTVGALSISGDAMIQNQQTRPKPNDAANSESVREQAGYPPRDPPEIDFATSTAFDASSRHP
jgi:hypothetical protein